MSRNKRRLSTFSSALLFTVAHILLFGAADCVAEPKNEYGKVELLRDRWGTAHVFADTDAGAMYGLGYAAAEDRAFQMYYNLRIIQGRLAEVVGDEKVGVDRRTPRGKNSAVRNDLKMRTIGYFRTAQKVAGNLDGKTLALLEAYSQGVNDYLSEHPKDLMYLFEKLGLEPEPWTPAASIASWWRLGIFFSGDGLRDLVSYYAIRDGKRQVRPAAAGRGGQRGQASSSGPKPDDAASVVQRGDVDDEWVRRLEAYVKKHGFTQKVDVGPLRRPASSPKFSHAWVVGGKKTTTGSSVLVSDPQTPVRNPSLLYEFHIQGKTFNARGVGVAGSPLLLIGFTKNVAWGMTALGADQADLFVLKTDPGRPNQYELDGKWLDMNILNETIRVKDGREQTLEVKETRFGPVVSKLVMGGVRRGDEVALKRVPLCETKRESVQAALGMMRAPDVHAFHKAMENWRFPSANCVFGDRAGNIGYSTVLALPVRSPKALLDGRAAHDGWRSENDWREFVPFDLLPHVLNPKQGWLVSANHRPIASFYKIPVGISTGAMGDTGRSWRLKERMAMRETFEPKDVLDIHYDTVSPCKRDLVRLGYHLRDVQKRTLEPDTLKALEYLEGWRKAGCKSDMSIVGTEILNIMPMGFRQNFAAAVIYGGGSSGLCKMLKTIDERLKKDPKAPLTGEEAEYVDLILRAAWRYGQSHFGDDPSKWHKIAKEKLRQRTLGYQATLDGFPSLDREKDLNYPALTCLEGDTIQCQTSQSYTQYVPLGDADGAMAVLPVGASENPESPHRLSDYENWADGRLRPAPLSRKKVESLAVSRKTLQGK